MDDAGAPGGARVNDPSQDGRVNLTILVPAFNEAANVAPVVDEILGTLAANPWVGPFEILLVDDGSRDATGAVMDRLAAQHPELRVRHHAVNRGFGAALRTGFAASRGLAVAFVTADGEMPADQVVELYRAMGDADLVMSRRERTVGAERHVLTFGFDLLVRLILGFWVDKGIGYYIVRGDLVRDMTIVSDTGLANLEVIMQCRRGGGRVATSGVMQVRPRLSGRSKVTNVRTVLRTLWEMWKLRWRLRRAAAGAA
jgi:glycosyltransferase involved in cell wall biosynthesis